MDNEKQPVDQTLKKPREYKLKCKICGRGCYKNDLCQKHNPKSIEIRKNITYKYRLTDKGKAARRREYDLRNKNLREKPDAKVEVGNII